MSTPARLTSIDRFVRTADTVATLDDTVAAFDPTKRINGKTIIRVLDLT
jgi:hypothetical protein